MGDNDIEYKFLRSSEDDENTSLAKHTRFESRIKRPLLIIFCIIFEIAQLLLIWNVYNGVQRIKSPKISEIDEYQKLMEFNTATVFNDDNKWAEDSDFANNFWRTGLMPEPALVSVDPQWAASKGMAPSAPTPGKPDESIYQIDVFHNLHCLFQIRQRLLTNESHLHDEHMFHCLNYLQQSIQCNADLMLGTTTDYIDYSNGDTHMCRDYNAILRWAENNKVRFNFREWVTHEAEGFQVHPKVPDSDSVS